VVTDVENFVSRFTTKALNEVWFISSLCFLPSQRFLSCGNGMG